MSFKIIEKCVKIFNILVNPQGAKLPKFAIFLKNGLFSVIIFFNQLVAWPLI